ncbi:Predicted lipoprotein [Arachidicoccus rhizosphaerae]|uniref:Predicted lipoprotein n=1 Tax=Arachidicoccus rhizosphaerae TaxID=551991 RepID=A0A1H4CWN8_9BACT|nr:imelysin family protein [Arachidicoccus rhizosphaerae]SEA64797.1 Predicted lipoprotein [Arachidicoccus rhizosphaerae]
MKKLFLPAVVIASLMSVSVMSCSKSDSPSNSQDIQEVETKALSDFVSVLGNPLYSDFTSEATTLDNAVKALVANPTAENQATAQAAWKTVRVVWEQSEGFLIGPVEDDNYDPNMDTWPTDRNAIDNLLKTNSNITSDELNNTDDALKGFHPLEYLLWETNPADYTDAEKNYMTALSSNILSNVKALQASWTDGGFGNEITNPGADSRYKTKQEALEAIANALIDICNEVGESKMPVPFGNTATDADSTQTESPYSHNSIVDFKNNIQGAYNSYTCSYGGATGTSLSSLVQVNNKNLDNQIRTAFQNAIKSFDGFGDITFEKAIYNNRTIVQNVITQVAALKTQVEDGLVPYIQQYVKD